MVISDQFQWMVTHNHLFNCLKFVWNVLFCDFYFLLWMFWLFDWLVYILGYNILREGSLRENQLNRNDAPNFISRHIFLRKGDSLGYTSVFISNSSKLINIYSVANCYNMIVMLRLCSDMKKDLQQICNTLEQWVVLPVVWNLSMTSLLKTWQPIFVCRLLLSIFVLRASTW